MIQQFINYDFIKSFSNKLVEKDVPFPWYSVKHFLTDEGFEILYQSFPSLELFEKHDEIERVYGQRPHNRYYLAYEDSIYRQLNRQDKGIVKHEELPVCWQSFISELETSRVYRNFIESLFGSEFNIRYAWHIGFTNSEVSPHMDASEKIGTHIFYFNTSRDWQEDWGGSILVLSGKSTDTMNPDFSDFTGVSSTQITDNHSFLFRNTPDAWHGVKPLTCPEGKYRRLFNVIFEFPQNPKKLTFSQAPLFLAKKLIRRTAALVGYTVS